MTVTTIPGSAAGLFSNTHLVDAPAGLVVVDPPMLRSDARAVRAAVESSGRPLAAVVYTHPHPDHVNGATDIIDGHDVPVFATEDTDRVSREIDGPKREFWTPVYGEDYPPVTTFATRLVKDGDTVDIAGLEFRVDDIGPGECETASLWTIGDEVFVGDLVYSAAHPWLFEARSATWLAQLARVRPLLEGRRMHVGHGAGGGIELVDRQVEYLEVYRTAVTELSGGADSLTDEAKGELLRRMDALWPGAVLGDLVGMSADPVAAELAGHAVHH